MRDDHILKINPRKAVRCLSPILPQSAIASIEAEIASNSRQLYRLGQSHLRHARRTVGPVSWRQRVSRGYYAVYAASRALRLINSGHYATDVEDHRRVGDLPHDFADRNIWSDFFTKFRADRNLADYDHTVSERDLENPSSVYLAKADGFLIESRAYLRRNGVTV